EAAIRKKYRFNEATWERLGKDDALVEAIELEKVRRIRSGAAKREKAQSLVVQACDVLGEIMRDAGASPKHRIDASKALDAFADPGPTYAPDSSDRFKIVINLSADTKNRQDKIVIDKQVGKIGPDAGRTIDHIDETAPPLLTAIAAKKDNDDGSRGGAW